MLLSLLLQWVISYSAAWQSLSICASYFLRVFVCLKVENVVFFRQHKPDNPVLPSKKNVPNRPAPPYGKPWFSLCLFVCSCVFTWPAYLPEHHVSAVKISLNSLVECVFFLGCFFFNILHVMMESAFIWWQKPYETILSQYLWHNTLWMQYNYRVSTAIYVVRIPH